MLCSLFGLAACGGQSAEQSTERSIPESQSLQKVLKERAVRLSPREHRIGQQMPDLSFTDLNGRAAKLSDYAQHAGLVIAIRDVGCPVSSRIGPATRRLEELFETSDVPFLFVNLSEHNTPEEMKQDVADFGFRGSYVADPEAHFGLALGALTTTDFFLLDASRSLIYRGAADDQYGRGVTLPEARHHFLRDAFDSMLRGERPQLQASMAPGCRLALEAPEPDPAQAANSAPVTYHGQVSRIVQNNCVVCHRDGGAAPFVLDSYKAMRGRRGMVRYMLEEKLMPPWLASEHSGPFVGDTRLSDQELDTLFTWYDQKMPEGDPADAPVPLRWSDRWEIGKPDFVFEDDEDFIVPAEGVVDLISSFVQVDIPEDIWVDRIQIMASAPQVVHHCAVLLRYPKGTSQASATGLRLDKDGHAWRFLMGYLPGAGSRFYPEGIGRLIPKGSVVRFVTHYTVQGKETPNKMRIGVVKAKTPPTYVVETRMIRRYDIEIPAGARNLQFDDQYETQKDVLLFSITPHMHLRGVRFLANATLPDGTEKHLIEIPQWDSDWQFSFVLRDMFLMPKGTKINYSVWYDNSSDNPNNPDPLQDVKDGPQIWDEMMQLVLEWVTPREPSSKGGP